MQLKHVQSISQPTEGVTRVTSACWSPNGKKLAVCTTDRVVILFDEDGVRRDRFVTKPADKVSILLFICISILYSFPLSVRVPRIIS